MKSIQSVNFVTEMRGHSDCWTTSYESTTAGRLPPITWVSEKQSLNKSALSIAVFITSTCKIMHKFWTYLHLKMALEGQRAYK